MSGLRSFAYTPGVMSLPQAAHYLGDISLSTLDRLVAEGVLEKRFIKSIPVIPLKDLDAYIENLPYIKGGA